MIQNKKDKTFTLTHEEISKIITSAIFGYTTAFTDFPFSKEQYNDLYETTLEQIEDGELLKEFISAGNYNKKEFERLKEEIQEEIRVPEITKEELHKELSKLISDAIKKLMER